MEIVNQLFKMFAIETLRYFLIAGIFFLVFYKLFSKKFQLIKIQNKDASKKDFFREVVYSLQSSLIFVFISAMVFLTPAIEYTNIYTDIHAFPLWYIPISVLLALVIHDTYFYWMHRTLHSKLLYKTVHKVHHLSLNPSPWAAFSFHFTEAFFEGFILVILVFTLPLHPLALLSFGISSLSINVYGHLGYEIMPLWFRNSFMFKIVNSSVHHNLHHRHFNSNFGLYFRFWDRVMGTEHQTYEAEFDALKSNQKIFE